MGRERDKRRSVPRDKGQGGFDGDGTRGRMEWSNPEPEHRLTRLSQTRVRACPGQQDNEGGRKSAGTSDSD